MVYSSPVLLTLVQHAIPLTLLFLLVSMQFSPVLLPFPAFPSPAYTTTTVHYSSTLLYSIIQFPHSPPRPLHTLTLTILLPCSFFYLLPPFPSQALDSRSPLLCHHAGFDKRTRSSHMVGFGHWFWFPLTSSRAFCPVTDYLRCYCLPYLTASFVENWACVGCWLIGGGMVFCIWFGRCFVLFLRCALSVSLVYAYGRGVAWRWRWGSPVHIIFPTYTGCTFFPTDAVMVNYCWFCLYLPSAVPGLLLVRWSALYLSTLHLPACRRRTLYPRFYRSVFTIPYPMRLPDNDIVPRLFCATRTVALRGYLHYNITARAVGLPGWPDCLLLRPTPPPPFTPATCSSAAAPPSSSPYCIIMACGHVVWLWHCCCVNMAPVWRCALVLNSAFTYTVHTRTLYHVAFFFACGSAVLYGFFLLPLRCLRSIYHLAQRAARRYIVLYRYYTFPGPVRRARLFYAWTCGQFWLDGTGSWFIALTIIGLVCYFSRSIILYTFPYYTTPPLPLFSTLLLARFSSCRADYHCAAQHHCIFAHCSSRATLPLRITAVRALRRGSPPCNMDHLPAVPFTYHHLRHATVIPALHWPTRRRLPALRSYVVACRYLVENYLPTVLPAVCIVFYSQFTCILCLLYDSQHMYFVLLPTFCTRFWLDSNVLHLDYWVLCQRSLRISMPCSHNFLQFHHYIPIFNITFPTYLPIPRFALDGVRWLDWVDLIWFLSLCHACIFILHFAFSCFAFSFPFYLSKRALPVFTTFTFPTLSFHCPFI